jgi:hypothetical protein
MSTIATELSLTPLAKSILLHLRKRGDISPMEAMVAYGTMRLAPAIYELRQAGYGIQSILREDVRGHRYTRYVLKGAVQ